MTAATNLNNELASIGPNKSSPGSPSDHQTWIGRTVKWLRADDVNTSIEWVFRRALAFSLSAALAISIVGIPLLILGKKEWNLQEPKEPPCHQTMQIYNSTIRKRKLKIPPLLRPEPPPFSHDPMDVPWKTMEGISIIANYLCEKHNFNNLFVCKNLDAFKRKLQEVDAAKEDMRLVLIVPSYQSSCACFHKVCSEPSHKVPDFHSQHKIPVLIEKTEGKIKLCVADSAGPIPLRMAYTNLDRSNTFSCEELLHAYMRAANLHEATYYYANVRRHFAHRGGCSTFALRDSVAFLQNPNFFNEIEAKGGIAPFVEQGTIDSPFYITNLPPEMMKSAQSMTALNKYKERNTTDGFDLTVKMGKHQRTWDESVAKHTVSVEGKSQNKMIDERIAKYHRLIIEYVTTLSLKELSKKIQRHLIA